MLSDNWESWQPISSCNCAVGCTGWCAFGMQPCSCCLPTLPPVAFSGRFPAEKIESWSLWWACLSGPRSGIEACLDFQRTQVALRFLLTSFLLCTRGWLLNPGTSLVLSLLNPAWKLGNRSCVPASSCESRYLFQVLFELFCVEETKNR